MDNNVAVSTAKKRRVSSEVIASWTAAPRNQAPRVRQAVACRGRRCPSGGVEVRSRSLGDFRFLENERGRAGSADVLDALGMGHRRPSEGDAGDPGRAPECVVRPVTENGRTLKCTSQGFEKE